MSRFTFVKTIVSIGSPAPILQHTLANRRLNFLIERVESSELSSFGIGVLPPLSLPPPEGRVLAETAYRRVRVMQVSLAGDSSRGSYACRIEAYTFRGSPKHRNYAPTFLPALCSLRPSSNHSPPFFFPFASTAWRVASSCPSCRRALSLHERFPRTRTCAHVCARGEQFAKFAKSRVKRRRSLVEGDKRRSFCRTRSCRHAAEGFVVVETMILRKSLMISLLLRICKSIFHSALERTVQSMIMIGQAVLSRSFEISFVSLNSRLSVTAKVFSATDSIPFRFRFRSMSRSSI